MAEIYDAVALQLDCPMIRREDSETEARARLQANIETIAKKLPDNLQFLGPNCRLVLLPEYVLTGFPMGESFPSWRDKAAFSTKSREYDQLAAIAQKHKIFLAGNFYEAIDAFPDLYFQSCFLLSPSGETELLYRRLNSPFSPSPYDVLDRWRETFGEQSLIPVAHTDIGSIGFIASDEILFPEVARCLAMQNVEVILHPSSEIHARQVTSKDICRRARAVENMSYLISANTAKLTGTGILQDSANGGSCIVDPKGHVIAQAGQGESLSAAATIDLHHLRHLRSQVSMQNISSRWKGDLYTEHYANYVGYPRNQLQNTSEPSRKDLLQSQALVIAQRQKERGGHASN